MADKSDCLSEEIKCQISKKTCRACRRKDWEVGDAAATKKHYTSLHLNTASVETSGRTKSCPLWLPEVLSQCSVTTSWRRSSFSGVCERCICLAVITFTFSYPIPPPVLPGCASALCPFAGRRIHPYSVNLLSHALLCQEREESREMRQMTAVWSSKFRSGLASLVAV